jgi:predicted MFS family arabinose efflux permease
VILGTFSIGGYWSIGAGLAPRPVPARSAARATAALVALAVQAPRLPALRATSPRGMRHGRDARIGLLAAFLAVLAHFGTRTRVEPFLLQATRVHPA